MQNKTKQKEYQIQKNNNKLWLRIASNPRPLG
jgi:hypothetical protein